MEERILHLLIEGRVQGVGFRWFVADVARNLDVAGWVRNREDGAVEIAASGSAEAIARLDAAVRDGPRGAQVGQVTNVEAPISGGLERPFRIGR